MGGEKGVNCAAPTCQNYRKTCPGLSFFRFPSEKKRCLKWIINTRRKDLEKLYFQISSRYFSTNYVLCAVHFTECCFMNQKHNKLVHDAIPSLFTITADAYYLAFGASLAMSSLNTLKSTSNVVDEEYTKDAMAQSRGLDIFIEKKLQELDKSKESSINICIPHQHPSPSLGAQVNIEPVVIPSMASPKHNGGNLAKCGLYYLCCSKDCLSTSTSSTLFPFPNNAQQAKWWLEQCGRSDLIPLLETHGSVPTNFMLCHKHFRKNQFVKVSRSSLLILVNSAMPTIFHSPEQQNSSVRPVTKRKKIDISAQQQQAGSRSEAASSDTDKDTCAYKLCMEHKKFTLYKFPQEPSRCMAWLLNCGYDNLPSELLLSTEPHSSGHRLCSQHFHDNAFFTLNDKTQLLNYSVPTVFCHGPLQYPCQHRSLPERYRKCSHHECHQLISEGVYHSNIDDADLHSRPVAADRSSSKQKLQQRYQTSISSAQYVICDKDNMPDCDDSPDEDQPQIRAPSRVKFEPMQFSDPQMKTAEKLNILDHEILWLKRERSLLSQELNRERQRRFTLKRAMHTLTSDRDEALTQEDALRYSKLRLPKSTYEFFMCQQLHRKCPPWNFDAVQIPTIANRCGLGVRETLYEIFKMPTLRTIGRYRRMIRSDPSSVPDNHLLKNDLEKKFHRKLTRRHRTNNPAPRTISAVIGDYIERKNVDDTIMDNVEESIADDEACSDTDNPSYHHKKYNSPQKCRCVEYDHDGQE